MGKRHLQPVDWKKEILDADDINPEYSLEHRYSFLKYGYTTPCCHFLIGKFYLKVCHGVRNSHPLISYFTAWPAGERSFGYTTQQKHLTTLRPIGCKGGLQRWGWPNTEPITSYAGADSWKRRSDAYPPPSTVTNAQSSSQWQYEYSLAACLIISGPREWAAEMCNESYLTI